MTTNRTVLGLCAAAIALLAFGCASNIHRHTDSTVAFPDALRECRMLQPGFTNRKSRLPPTNPRVAECLSRHGWNPEGTQIPVGSQP